MSGTILLIQNNTDYGRTVYILKRAALAPSKIVAENTVLYMQVCANSMTCFRYLEMQFDERFTNMQIPNVSAYCGELQDMIDEIHRTISLPEYRYGSTIIPNLKQNQKPWSIFDGKNATALI